MILEGGPYHPSSPAARMQALRRECKRGCEQLRLLGEWVVYLRQENRERARTNTAHQLAYMTGGGGPASVIRGNVPATGDGGMAGYLPRLLPAECSFASFSLLMAPPLQIIRAGRVAGPWSAAAAADKSISKISCCLLWVYHVVRCRCGFFGAKSVSHN